ncbi:MAG TPA: Hsp20/alpha crystallin family protein [Candidatus Xenobia bacterium]|nr:Hsp20/alpha crystallin family protein [Candidatus Xenobia bacterium]
MTRSIMRFDPLRDLATLQSRVDRLFEDVLGRGRNLWDVGEALEGATWAPAVDIVETDNEIVLKADLPGIDPKDVDVQVHDGTLTLKGERKFESDVKEDNYRRIERTYGAFVRSFSLPQTVDSERVSASYRNGVLELKLPKRPEAKPKQIKVAVSNN